MANSIYELLMGAGPDQSETAQAMADAIRGNREIAMTGALATPRSKGGAIAAMSGLAQHNAENDSKLLERAAEQRMRYGEEAKARENQFKMALEIAKHSRPQFHVTAGNPYQAGMALDPATGQWVPAGQGYARPGGGGGLGEKDLDKRWYEFVNKYNPSLASARSPFGVAQGLINRAERIERIPGTNELKDLDRRQMEELAIGVASMMSGGNIAARATIDNLVPKSLRGKTREIQEWLSNTPTGLQQQAFAKKLLGILIREKQQGLAQVHDAIRQGASGYSEVLQHPKYRERARDYLQTAGFAPEYLEAWTGLGAREGVQSNYDFAPTGQAAPAGQAGPVTPADIEAVKQKYGLGRSR